MNKKINNTIKLLLICLVTYSTTYAQDYIAPPMVNIPSGNFMMGSNIGKEDSKPMHSVSVAAFQMAKYPVTIHEFRSFVKETDYKTTATKGCPDFINRNWYSPNPEKKNTATWEKHNLTYSDYQPVTCITFKDVNAYIAWLNKKSGLKYRLPTEEEWEYAAKANTTTKYFWGNDSTQAHLYGNFADQSSEYFVSKEYGASYVGFIGTTNGNDGEPYGAIVGLYDSNPFGLYDMIGNVSQFLSSCYDADGYQKKEKASIKCKFVASRGGSWHYTPGLLWTRGRARVDATNSYTRQGFRLAIDGHRKTVEASTKVFEKSLKKAQHIRLATRPIIPNAPKNIQLVKLKDSIYKISWKPSNDPNVIGYEIYQSNNSYSHLLGRFYQEHYNKIKTVNSNRNTTEVTLSEKGNSFRIVTKTNILTSLPSNPVVVPKKTTVISIPGKIAMENTIALENLTLNYYKATSDLPELYYLTALAKAFEPTLALTTFKVKVEKSGWYQLNYSGGPRSRKTGAFFMLYQDNTLIGEVNYDSKIKDKTSNRHKVYLDKGNHDLKISFHLNLTSMDMWNLFRLEFTEIKAQ